MKKRMRTLIYIFVFLYLSGCANKVRWWKPTEYAKVNGAQAQRECIFEANKSYSHFGMGTGGFGHAIMADKQAEKVYLSCMGAKGFIQVDPPTEEDNDS